jgi:hypothetical protein
VNDEKLKLALAPQLKQLVKKQNVPLGRPVRRPNGSCAKQNKHDSASRQNKQRQLGERKLPAKRPNDSAVRESKPSRQHVPPVRPQKRGLAKRDNVPNDWHGRLKKRGADNELLKKLLGKLPSLPSNNGNGNREPGKRKTEDYKPRRRQPSAPHKELLKKPGKLKLRERKPRDNCEMAPDLWSRLPLKNILLSEPRYSIPGVSSMSPSAGSLVAASRHWLMRSGASTIWILMLPRSG